MMPRTSSTASRFAPGLLLAAATFAIFSRAGGNEFLLYDDAQYIVSNPRVAGGLSSDGVRWAFTSFYAFNWHPLTWLSHMLDTTLFGLSSRGTHLVNALLHAANAALLLLVLEEMTGSRRVALLVAAGFALHPLHVESVAWAAERKDVLSAFFWIAAMGAWLRYARRPRAGRYLAAAGLFALGLLSKPMVVTLPLALVLLDFWPLGRLGAPARSAFRAGGPFPGAGGPVLLEKAPLLALSAASAALTVHAQAAGGALRGDLALPLRLENAVVSVVSYLGTTIWPAGLAVFYPHPVDRISGWLVAGAIFLVAAITLLVARGVRRRPWRMAGWGWYAVTLLPVLGLVQVGNQAKADRYTYLPLVGIFLAAAWEGDRRARGSAGSGKAAAAAAGALLAAWASMTWVQIGHWQDGVTLFTHSLRSTPDNAHVRYNLGRALFQAGRGAESLLQLERSVALNPRDQHALNDLGIALSQADRRAEAVAMFRRAIAIDPSYADPYLNLGLAHLSLKDARSAQAVYRELRAVDPQAAARLAVFFGPAAGH